MIMDAHSNPYDAGEIIGEGHLIVEAFRSNGFGVMMVTTAHSVAERDGGSWVSVWLLYLGSDGGQRQLGPVRGKTYVEALRSMVDQLAIIRATPGEADRLDLHF